MHSPEKHCIWPAGQPLEPGAGPGIKLMERFIGDDWDLKRKTSPSIEPKVNRSFFTWSLPTRLPTLTHVERTSFNSSSSLNPAEAMSKYTIVCDGSALLLWCRMPKNLLFAMTTSINEKIDPTRSPKLEWSALPEFFGKLLPWPVWICLRASWIRRYPCCWAPSGTAYRA